MKDRLELNLDGSAFNIRFKNSATQQPLRPLRFLKWTFTVPIIIRLDTFNRTKFVTTYWNLKAVNFGRHHPLSSGLRKNPRQNRSGKKRQKAAMNLSQYDAFCRWQFAASCRLLPPAVMHTAVAPEGTGSKSVRHLP
jgi:hypothetical protein